MRVELNSLGNGELGNLPDGGRVVAVAAGYRYASACGARCYVTRLATGRILCVGAEIAR